jgi:hypothetical protein
MPREPSGTPKRITKSVRPERRRFARIFFNPPLPGKFGRTAVEVLDLSLLGVTIAHYEHLALNASGELRMLHPDQTLALPCHVKRSQVTGLKHVLTGKNAYRTVLVFSDPDEATRRALEELMVAEIKKLT